MKEETKKRRKFVKEKAIELNKNLPKSEIWFQNQLTKRDVKFNFKANECFCGYIPDLIDKDYKIIVEIDGSIHRLPEIKERDKKKDKTFKKHGYLVVRIIAYDHKSLKKGLSRIFKHIKENSSTVRYKKEAKTRRNRYINRTKAISKNQKQLKMCSVCKSTTTENMIEYEQKSIRVCSNCEPDIVI